MSLRKSSLSTPRNARSRWTRRELAGLFAGGLAASARAQSSDSRPPNVLVMMTSEHRGDALGCTGHPLVRTSVVDLLTQHGGILRNFYATSPAARPSRASVLTGRYPHSHGVLSDSDQLPESEVLLPQLLAKHGYRTGLAGRLDVGESKTAELFDFAADEAEYRAFLAEKHPATKGDAMATELDTRRQYPWLWGRSTTPFADFPTQWIGDKAEEFLRSAPKDQPWFFLAGFPGPAHPFVVPPPWDTRYPGSTITLPQLPLNRPTPPTAEDRAAHYVTRDQAPALRELLQRYYGAVSFVDEQLGRILNVLRELDGVDNTIIVFTSDFGSNMGDGGRMLGGTPTEGALHIPGVIYYKPLLMPTIAEQSIDSTCLVPTILDLAGLPIPDGFDGRSLRTLLTEKDAKWSGAAYSELGFQTVRTEDWRLTLPGDHPTWEPQLFAARDRIGRENLYGSPDAAKAQKQLEGMLSKWTKKKPPAVRI